MTDVRQAFMRCPKSNGWKGARFCVRWRWHRGQHRNSYGEVWR